GMRQVMFDRLQLDLLQIETQLLQAPLDAFPVAVVTAVAHENGIQGAVRRIPGALGVVPACLLEDTDGCEGYGDDIHVRRSDSGLLQAEFGRLVGPAVLGMLVPQEAVFPHGSNRLAIDIQGSGWIMAQSAGQSQNGKSQGCTAPVEVK